MLLLFKSLFEGLEGIVISGLNLVKATIDFLVSIVTGLFKPVKAVSEKGSGCVTALVLALLVFLLFTFRNTTCQAYSCVSAGCQGLDRSWSAYLTDSGSDDNDSNGSNDNNSDVPAYVIVKVSPANVRAGASTSSQKLCTLKKGQKLQVEDAIQVDGVTWYGVTLTGKDKKNAGQDFGWVRGDLVEESG